MTRKAIAPAEPGTQNPEPGTALASPDSLVPALRRASPEEARALLAGLDRQALKPIAKAIAGMRRIKDEGDPATLRETILRVLSSAQVLHPARPEIGDTLVDEESGEEVAITPEMVERVRELSDRLAQGEYSVQRGMIQIASALRDFKAARGYLVFGFKSFAAYCHAGQLRVMGQTRGHSWAYNLIGIIDKLGYEVVHNSGQLSTHQLLRLTSALTREGMEETLEDLQQEGVLRYTADDGRKVELPLPQSKADAAAWRQAIGDIAAQARANARRTRQVEEDAELQRGEMQKEADALRARIQALLGHAESLDEELAQEPDGDAAEGEELTPERAQKLKADLKTLRRDLRQARADLAEKQGAIERLGRLVDERRKADADLATIERAREAVARFGKKFGEALRELEELQPLLASLPEPARELVINAGIGAEHQLRIVQDRFEGVA